MVWEVNMDFAPTDTWLIVATALVLFMTPGVAFFYSGMTRSKSTLNMMMMSFVTMGIVGVIWVLWGYSMTAGSSVGEIFGNPFEYFGLEAILNDPEATDAMIYAAFGGTFAIITVALISGSIADRAKFSAWAIFVAVWVTLVYAPLAYMVWNFNADDPNAPGGLLNANGAIGKTVGVAIDFAGGTVVHISAGAAALVLALVLGKRRGFGKDPSQRPHNLPLVMLGAAILWFGWFGFNAGLAATPQQAGLIIMNTMAAPAAAMIGWLAVERIRDGRPTSLGAASGIVAGLVAITPACANVSPLAAIGLGLVAGAVCAMAVSLKFKLGYDDSLDVVGVHLVAGIIGTLALGFIALPLDGTPGGLFYGGGFGQLAAQAIAALIAIVLSGGVTLVLALALKYTIGFRVDRKSEEDGVDLSEHAETAYEFGGLGVGGPFRPAPGRELVPDYVAAGPTQGSSAEESKEESTV